MRKASSSAARSTTLAREMLTSRAPGRIRSKLGAADQVLRRRHAGHERDDPIAFGEQLRHRPETRLILPLDLRRRLLALRVEDAHAEDAARNANSRPISPRPMMPTVLP